MQAGEVQEVVSVSPLSEEEADVLITSIAGPPIIGQWHTRWPESLQDAVRRPLFAVLTGMYLRERDGRPPRSTGELLSDLVERSLGRVTADQASVNSLLQRLAVICTDRAATFIPTTELAPKNQSQSLLDSRLVVERGRTIGFPLPILTQWFAAHSLAAGTPTPDALVTDPLQLERWRYPLIILSAVFDHDTVSTVLVPLAAHHAAFTSEIVSKGLVGPPTYDEQKDVPMLPARECAQRIRTALQAWTTGIGPLAALTAPVGGDAKLLPCGVRTTELGTIIAWYDGPDTHADVFELPPDADVHDRVDWPFVYGVHPRQQSAWAWRATHERLARNLATWLNQRMFPVDEGPLLHEGAWQAALVLTQRGDLRRAPVPLEEIESYLDLT